MGAVNEMLKPSFDEWMYWSQAVIDRLTTIVHVYSHPPHKDASIAHEGSQLKISQAVDLLRRLHNLTDEDCLRLSHKEGGRREGHVVQDVQPLFREVLRRLPVWSADMQILLKSPWFDNCAGKLAEILFRGPSGRMAEGIGSGQVEHGRLPETITNLMEREALGDGRTPREQPKSSDSEHKRTELARAWTKQNSSFLRSAGRLD